VAAAAAATTSPRAMLPSRAIEILHCRAHTAERIRIRHVTTHRCKHREKNFGREKWPDYENEVDNDDDDDDDDGDDDGIGNVIDDVQSRESAPEFAAANDRGTFTLLRAAAGGKSPNENASSLPSERAFKPRYERTLPNAPRSLSFSDRTMLPMIRGVGSRRATPRRR